MGEASLTGQWWTQVTEYGRSVHGSVHSLVSGEKRLSTHRTAAKGTTLPASSRMPKERWTGHSCQAPWRAWKETQRSCFGLTGPHVPSSTQQDMQDTATRGPLRATPAPCARGEPHRNQPCRGREGGAQPRQPPLFKDRRTACSLRSAFISTSGPRALHRLRAGDQALPCPEPGHSC